MRVELTLPDWAGCGHYRAIWPGEASGCEVSFREGIKLTQGMCSDGSVHVVAIAEEVEADVFVISRPLNRTSYESIPHLQSQGIAVVVDVDDDFEAVDPRHKAWRAFQPKHSPHSNRVYLKQACAAADLVTCTTPALAERYGAHGRVLVLPNRIPKTMLGALPSKPRDGRTVGWAGYVGTHPVDLKAAAGGVGMACRDSGARFLNIGTGDGVREQLGLGGVAFEATGPAEFEDYPHALARFDVGIAPLHESAFNRAKSALKGLEMAAVGVPFVASDMPDYERIAADGIGVIAQPKAKDWRRKVRALLDDEGRRQELADQGRQAVIDKHLYEDHGHLWAEAWELALGNRQKMYARTAA